MKIRFHIALFLVFALGVPQSSDALGSDGGSSKPYGSWNFSEIAAQTGSRIFNITVTSAMFVAAVVTLHQAYKFIKARRALSVIRAKKQSSASEDKPLAIPEDKLKIISQRLSSSSPSRELYLELITDFPWEKTPASEVDISLAQKIFDEEHYGLERVKERVINHLSVLTLNPKLKTHPICLVGPAGTGKTTIAQSIANVLKRKFYPIHLSPSGLANEPVVLKGSSPVYQGSEPGELVKALCRTGVTNPVILLDEIDKVSSADTAPLLEILDAERNNNFQDKFMGFGIDLSDCLFVATANNIESIPLALKDRMDIIHIDPYTNDEQVEICRRFLIPRIMKQYEVLSEDCVERLSAVVPKVVEILSEHSDGVRAMKMVLEQLTNKLVAYMVSHGQELDLTPDNVHLFIDETFTRLRLGEPRNYRDYCNKVLRNLKIPKELFSDVQRRVDSYLSYKNGEEGINQYIDWVARVPFEKYAEGLVFDSATVRQKLDLTHKGLDSVKERITNFIAAQGLSREQQGKVICLVGPPGVGKTTIAESIAAAAGRPFKSVAMGSEGLRLHPGSESAVGLFKPSGIARALCDAGVLNPLILLDEVDKLDVQSALGLLELFDPAQNKSIHDPYLGFGLDYSKTFFIASANSIDQIPFPIRDRMEIINIEDYSPEQKVEIGLSCILPRILKDFQPVMSEVCSDAHAKLHIDTALSNAVLLVNRRGASGVRFVDRIARAIVERIAPYVQGSRPLDFESLMAPEELVSYVYSPEILQDDWKGRPGSGGVGVVNGLYASTLNGSMLTGGLIKIEATVIPYGKGKFEITGLPGDMARDAAILVRDYVRSVGDKYDIPASSFQECDINIGARQSWGAEGDSATMAFTAALISALTKRSIRSDYAITGSMDIQGNARPVGGYRSKILGARQAGIYKVIVPACARPVIERMQARDFPDMKITYVDTIDQVLDLVLEAKS